MAILMTNQKAFEQMKKAMDLRGFAPSTQKAYLGAVRHLERSITIPLCDADYEHVREFLLNAINVRKLSSQYINTTYSGFKFLFECVFQREWNMKHIPRLKKKHKLPLVLSQNEVQSIFAAVTNLKHKAILMTIYSAGLRVSEAVNLRITDIDSENMRIFIRQGKGNKNRYAVLGHSTLKILREYFKEYRPKVWLFQTANSDAFPKPVHTRTVQHVFREAKVRACIKANATPHTLRHSFATHLVERGISLLKVKELLGHDKLETTMLYVHLANKDIFAVKSPIDFGMAFDSESGRSAGAYNE